MSWLNSFLNWVQSVGGAIPISWVDFLTLLVICLGVVRGRKRGLSEEIFDVLKWLIIVAAAGFLYHPLGNFLNQKPVLSALTFYLMAYVLIAVSIWAVFGYIKKKLGEKVIESDVFGRFEFYGGMGAGALRWLCVYFFILSMLHAPFYSDEYRVQHKKEVDYNFGSDFFPSIMKVQDSVYASSLTGKGALLTGPLLMDQVSGDVTPLRGENSMARRRERAVDDAYGRK